MRPFILLILSVCAAVGTYAQSTASGFILVEGGTFRNPRSNYYNHGVAVSSFYIGRHEVTQREWLEVMGNNPSKFKGDNLPVEMVTWYDCITFCNKRSLREGLKPYYTIDKSAPDPANESDNDNIKWIVTTNPGSNGYRLPTEAEWEYAAGGGQKSAGYLYSGSNDVAKVAWYWQNSGDQPLTGLWSWPNIEKNHNQTKAVGTKSPNELGLYDMSGNVREWCWDWYGVLPTHATDPQGAAKGTGRVWRGGGWMGGDFCCATTFRAQFDANGLGPDQGLRLCRNK